MKDSYQQIIELDLEMARLERIYSMLRPLQLFSMMPFFVVFVYFAIQKWPLF
ncbi:hypothetical protein ACFOD0_04425 [Shewanella intestini]|uniref:Uncharacterized protein n=1 Tax=Shewanella intestini TaxID=2017544 RepID=A0ABS5I0J9_9GAMM|nr:MULTISPECIES: hypothetical protein [Shewanella]MBR9727549.1 hypothetical protein [Shewanella intestini]MRG35301.1 hypothetical protein [Shewanella sp. XMDDZSB0408]